MITIDDGVTIGEKKEKRCSNCIHGKRMPDFINFDFVPIEKYSCMRLNIDVEPDFYCKYYEGRNK